MSFWVPKPAYRSRTLDCIIVAVRTRTLEASKPLDWPGRFTTTGLGYITQSPTLPDMEILFEDVLSCLFLDKDKSAGANGRESPMIRSFYFILIFGMQRTLPDS